MDENLTPDGDSSFVSTIRGDDLPTTFDEGSGFWIRVLSRDVQRGVKQRQSSLGSIESLKMQ